MLHRIARLLLVAALVSSGASAPACTCARLRTRGVAGARSGGRRALCAPSCRGRALASGGEPGSSRRRCAVDGRRAAPARPAVTLSAAAIETSSIGVDTSSALVDAPETGIPSSRTGARAPVAADAGPDPPPLILLATRAPSCPLLKLRPSRCAVAAACDRTFHSGKGDRPPAVWTVSGEGNTCIDGDCCCYWPGFSG